ncbi:MAG: C39 family peptidase [Chloroflexia bacterium]
MKTWRRRAYCLLAALIVVPAFQLQPIPAQAQSEAAYIVGFPSVEQWYSLSCEYAAAAAVTLYYGNLVSQRDFLNEVPQDPNPHIGFRGNVNAEWGGTTNYGVYAEPLVPVLAARGYEAQVFYGPVSRLKAELAAGHPVVVWYAGKRGYLPRTYVTYAGDTFSLTPWEHAVVAYGYDAGGVRVMDVGNGGRYYYAWSSFTARWNYFDEMALVITPASN